MSTLQIQERVVIKASVDAVWRLLLAPERVVQCLPGAGYDGAESDTVFLGHMKVKVGPITTIFHGKATMAEVVEAEHRVRIVGEGKDKNGNGTARMTMLGRVVATDGGAELVVDADVDISGKLVTFGRGLIKSVSAQLFKQFATRAQELLEGEAAAGEGAAAPGAGSEAAAPAASEAAPSAPTDAPTEATTAAPTDAPTDAPTAATTDTAPGEPPPSSAAAALASSHASAAPSEVAAASASSEVTPPPTSTSAAPGDAATASTASTAVSAGGAAAASSATTTATATSSAVATTPTPRPTAPRPRAAAKAGEEEALNALPLLARAIGSSLGGLFVRLFHVLTFRLFDPARRDRRKRLG